MLPHVIFEELATELLANIFLSCNSVSDVISLSSTCYRLHNLYTRRRLQFLQDAAEAEYGPLEDAIQLATHNDSQPAHIKRNVPLSDALLHQVIRKGRIAVRWEEIYPKKKWKDNYEDRRLLNRTERYALRRALYRLWLYDRAFHNPLHPRQARMNLAARLERAQLLHNWNEIELAEMADVQQVLRGVLKGTVCPSNGTVQRKFRKRFPEANHQLLFNMHLNYPPPFGSFSSQSSISSHNQNNKYYAKYKPTSTHEPGCEGWGDDIAHYYVVEDMLKLDPEQILELVDQAPLKWQVQQYTRDLGDWFENNGETFMQTLELVLGERNEHVGEFMDAVADGEIGIVKDFY